MYIHNAIKFYIVEQWEYLIINFLYLNCRSIRLDDGDVRGRDGDCQPSSYHCQVAAAAGGQFSSRHGRKRRDAGNAFVLEIERHDGSGGAAHGDPVHRAVDAHEAAVHVAARTGRRRRHNHLPPCRVRAPQREDLHHAQRRGLAAEWGEVDDLVLPRRRVVAEADGGAMERAVPRQPRRRRHGERLAGGRVGERDVAGAFVQHGEDAVAAAEHDEPRRRGGATAPDLPAADELAGEVVVVVDVGGGRPGLRRVAAAREEGERLGAGVDPRRALVEQVPPPPADEAEAAAGERREAEEDLDEGVGRQVVFHGALSASAVARAR